MARHNNTSRSLQIISKAQGWDPNQIVDTRRPGSDMPEYEHPVATKYEVNWARENIFAPDTHSIPDSARDTSEPCPDPGIGTNPSFQTPTLRENQNNRTTNADPHPAKPGAGGRR